MFNQKIIVQLFVFQEGENNEKFDSHPCEPETLPAYLLVHNQWYYGLDLATSLILLALALGEDPAVPAFKVLCRNFYIMCIFKKLFKKL